MTQDRTQMLMGWCIQRQQHGEQPYWMAAVLATMIGQIGLPGGGLAMVTITQVLVCHHQAQPRRAHSRAT